MPHLGHFPAIIDQCHSPVLPDLISQLVTRNDGSSAYSLPSKMNGTKQEQTKDSSLPPSTSPNGMRITPYSYPPSTPEHTNEYSRTIHSASTTRNLEVPDGIEFWKTTPTSESDSIAGEMENPNYASIPKLLKKRNWPENIITPRERNVTDSAAYTTRWSSTMPKNENANWSNSDSNNYMRSWTKPDVVWNQQPEEGVVLRSAVTMPTKNFFPLSLAPTRSSAYPFLYTTHKQPATSTSLNCHAQDSHPRHSTSTLLNCNFTQTLHDMPSGLNGGLSHLSQWPDNMPSSCMNSLDPLGHLGHLGHLGYLGLLGHLSYLNVLDPEPIDIPLHTFIQEEEDS
jgi:hypothetical protein